VAFYFWITATVGRIIVVHALSPCSLCKDREVHIEQYLHELHASVLPRTFEMPNPASGCPTFRFPPPALYRHK
jgi:hypothetical protein